MTTLWWFGLMAVAMPIIFVLEVALLVAVFVWIGWEENYGTARDNQKLRTHGMP